MSSHRVPTHLNTPDGIWVLSMRQWGLVFAAYRAAQEVWGRVPAAGPFLGDLVRWRYEHLLIPEAFLPLGPVAATLAVAAPFVALALPIQPPPEHGLASLAGWLRQRDVRRPLDDVLWPPERVDRWLGEPALSGPDSDVLESEFGLHVAWELPPVNLRLTDSAGVEIAQDLWGAFLLGLSYPVQTLVTAHRVDLDQLVAGIDRFSGPRADNARRLAAWLRAHAAGRNLIERRHFLAACLPDDNSLAEAVQQLGEGLGSLGLRHELIRRLQGEELEAVVRRTFSPRPLGKRRRLGPDGPWRVAARQLQSDQEWHEVEALGRWMRVIRDDALSAFTDGPYATDVVQHINPVDPDEVLRGLERKLTAMKAGTPNRQRKVALDDLERFVEAVESGEENPFEATTLFHVHHAERAAVRQEVARLESRARRSGARLQNLRWEQPAALRACAPLGVNTLPGRAVRVDTSSLKRLYPWSASACWPEGSVPIGETPESRRPVGWTPWRRPLIANANLAVYGGSGSGKGFFVKTGLSRLLFAGATQEIYGFDQAPEDAELGEYGRFAAYCGLEYRHLASLADLKPALAGLDRPSCGYGIIWNLARLAPADRPRAFLELAGAVWKRAAAYPAFRQLIVDELWSFVRDALAIGADPELVALAHSLMDEICRMGRHVRLGGVWMTQRVRDAVQLPLVQTIQTQSASQLYGQQHAGDISRIAPDLQWTDAEQRAVRGLVPGRFLLAAGPWRVVVRVTASEEEFQMANTDGRQDQLTRDQVQPSARRLLAGDELDLEPLGAAPPPHTNGHVTVPTVR
jgi:hypothetical protein